MTYVETNMQQKPRIARLSAITVLHLLLCNKVVTRLMSPQIPLSSVCI